MIDILHVYDLSRIILLRVVAKHIKKKKIFEGIILHDIEFDKKNFLCIGCIAYKLAKRYLSISFIYYNLYTNN